MPDPIEKETTSTKIDPLLLLLSDPLVKEEDAWYAIDSTTGICYGQDINHDRIERLWGGKYSIIQFSKKL